MCRVVAISLIPTTVAVTTFFEYSKKDFHDEHDQRKGGAYDGRAACHPTEEARPCRASGP